MDNISVTYPSNPQPPDIPCHTVGWFLTSHKDIDILGMETEAHAPSEQKFQTPWTILHPFPPSPFLVWLVLLRWCQKGRSFVRNLLQGSGVQELSHHPQFSQALASSPRIPVPSKHLGQGSPKLPQKNLSLTQSLLWNSEKKHSEMMKHLLSCLKRNLGLRGTLAQPPVFNSRLERPPVSPFKRKVFLKATMADEWLSDWLIICFKNQYRQGPIPAKYLSRVLGVKHPFCQGWDLQAQLQPVNMEMTFFCYPKLSTNNVFLCLTASQNNDELKALKLWFPPAFFLITVDAKGSALSPHHSMANLTGFEGLQPRSLW